MDAKELKPCPFCGGEAELRQQGNDFTKSRKLTIRCKGCRVQITNGAIRNDMAWLERATAEDWNRRAALPHSDAAQAPIAWIGPMGMQTLQTHGEALVFSKNSEYAENALYVAPGAAAQGEVVPLPYVERFHESSGEGGGVYPHKDGDFVRYSDFVAWHESMAASMEEK